MTEAIALNADIKGPTVDPQAIELGLQKVFFGLLEGTVKPDSAAASARVADAVTRSAMTRIKLLKMTTKSPSRAMLKQWNLE